jgi:hypothetical protein
MKALVAGVLITGVLFGYGCCSFPAPRDGNMLISAAAWWDPEKEDSIVCVPIVSYVGDEAVIVPQFATSVFCCEIAPEWTDEELTTTSHICMPSIPAMHVRLVQGQSMFTRIVLNDLDVSSPSVFVTIECSASVPPGWSKQVQDMTWTGRLEHSFVLKRGSSLLFPPAVGTTNILMQLHDNHWAVDSDELRAWGFGEDQRSSPVGAGVSRHVEE